jgi:ABC-type branched-subunit amino acid transport system ATPase component
VIEHNMRVIMDLAQRVLALQLGRVIAQGSPGEIMANPRVIDAYLGQAWRGP